MTTDRVVAQDPIEESALPRLGLATARALALRAVLAAWLLGCVSGEDYGHYEPPAWKTPIGYSLTRDTARTAGGPAPVLVVRLQSTSLPEPVLTWTPIPDWIQDAEDIDALPFLPTPDTQQLRVHVELAGCAEVVFFANRADGEASAFALIPEQDVLLAALAAERWAALPADPCAMALRYGTPAGRHSTWLQVVTHAGVVTEFLILEPEPGYWALVPLAAIAETTGYIVLAGLVAGLVAVDFMVSAFFGGMGG